MIAMRHTGIYVNDILQLETFYKTVFDMVTICSNAPDKNSLLDELLGVVCAEIVTTKLITPYGKQHGQGDMLELVKVTSKLDKIPQLPLDYPIFMIGMGHLAFGIDDIYKTVEAIKGEKGVQKTKIHRMNNNNLCCFCRDPEGNWIELIQRCGEENGDMVKLDGKIAIVTGGTSGIGGYISSPMKEQK